MINTNNLQATNPFGDIDDKKKPKTEKTTKVETTPSTLLKADNLNLSNTKNNSKTYDVNNIFANDKDDKKTSGNGWKIKTVHLNAGYMLDNNVIHTGPMKIVNQQNGTDLTITGYNQKDRKNWEYLSIKEGQRFAPDEPQFNLGVNATFENNFGVEIDAKHNKIIMDGYDQTVHMKGMMNGTPVDYDAPLKTFMDQHENTYGNMQISALGTYNFDLPAPANHKFSFITKAGPSAIITTTHSHVKNPSGQFDVGTSPMQVSGYGGILENGLRYQLGPKAGRAGVELTHSISYLNYSSYGLVGGYNASHSAVYNTVAVKLTVGLSGNKK